VSEPSAEQQEEIQKLKDKSDKQRSVIKELETRANQDTALLIDLGMLITRQKDFIKVIYEKLKDTIRVSNVIKNKWEDLQTFIKPKFELEENVLSHSLTSSINEANFKQYTTDTSSDHLYQVTLEICEKLNIDFGKTVVKDESYKPPAYKGGHKKKEDKKPAREPVFEDYKTIEVPAAIAKGADVEEIQEENRALRIQLINARRLLKNNASQIRELERVVQASGRYLESMDKANTDVIEEVQEYKKKIVKLESQEYRAKQAVAESQRVTKQRKAERKDYEGQMQTLLNRNRQLEEDVKSYKKMFDHYMHKMDDLESQETLKKQFEKLFNEKDVYANNLVSEINSLKYERNKLFKEINKIESKF
jgi:hypothetical protein